VRWLLAVLLVASPVAADEWTLDPQTRLHRRYEDLATSQQLIDADQEGYALAWQMPYACEISSAEFNWGTITTGGDLNVKLLPKSTTDGDGCDSGTVHKSVTITVDAADDNDAEEGIFASTYSATMGEWLCIHIVRDTALSSTFNGQFLSKSGVWAFGAAASPLLKTSSSGTWSEDTGDQPGIAVRCSTGELIPVIGTPALSSTTIEKNINTGSTPDEYGVKWTQPVDATVIGMTARIEVEVNNDTLTMTVYDSVDTALGSYTPDKDVLKEATVVRYWTLYFTSAISVSEGAVYRFTILPSDATNLGVGGHWRQRDNIVTAFDAADKILWSGHPESWVETTRTDLGAWTDAGNEPGDMPYIWPIFGPPTYPTAGGGGGILEQADLSGGLTQ